MTKDTKKITVIIALALCALFAAMCAPRFSARANSAQTHWSGRDSFGAYVTDEDCPVVVDGEKLTLRVPGFPNNYYDTVEEFESYAASVTAEYTFSNPSNLDVDMTLVFPFGVMPDYLYGYYDYEAGGYVYFDDTARYTVTADGKEIERALRYTYYSWEFNPENDIPKLSESKRSSGIYTPQTPVTVYTYEYTVERGDSSAYFPAHIGADFGSLGNKNTTRVLLETMNSMQGRKYGFGVRDGIGTFSMYVIGEPLEKMPEWKVYTDGGLRRTAAGEVRLSEKIPEKVVTFEELALTHFNKEGSVSETDWYNAVLDRVSNYGNTLVCNGSIYDFDVSANLMRWYEYDLQIPAGGTVVNSVTAPIYPSINGGWEPAKYEYTYLLSPASTWKDFGSFEVEIETPYYLLGSSLSFEKVEGGYRYLGQGLPNGELNFTLSSSASPERVKGSYAYVVLAVMILVAPVIVAVSAIRYVAVLIILICIFLLRKKRN